MSSLVFDILVVAGSVLLGASAIIALYRIVRGPSILDRMIATDVVLASIMCGLGGFMALSHRTDLLPVLIVLAMLGFVGSVSVSRYVSKSDSMTPGAEVGALSDFSASDWHMPRDAEDDSTDAETAAESEWSEDVARGIFDVADGPGAVTVRDEAEDGHSEAEDGDDAPEVGLDVGSDPDVDGDGEGTGPDPGPEDSDDGSRTGPEPDRADLDPGSEGKRP